MINAGKVRYKIIGAAQDGEQFDLSETVHHLTWSEGEKALSSKIKIKMACADVGGGLLSKYFRMGTPIMIYADEGGGYKETIRGFVRKLEVEETSGAQNLNVECSDEAGELRRSQDDYYFTPDHGAKAIMDKILSDWGVPNRIETEDEKLGKKVYRGKYLSDMIGDVLKDLKERGKGIYFIRAREGVIEIIPRGTNETIYCFDTSENVTRMKEEYDGSKTVTKVKVVGKLTEEGHQRVEGTVEGRTDLGVRQVIYRRGDKENLSEAETAAQKILDENGVQRKVTCEAPDVPSLRKGDRIRLNSMCGEGYFFIKGITHDATAGKMTMELDWDKERSESEGLGSYELAITDESGSGSPP